MELIIKSNKREEIIDITENVEKQVEVKKGKACLIFTPHTTCSVIINESYGSGVEEDILTYLRKQIPKGVWKHDLKDSNGDAHIKASLLGNFVIVPFENGKLVLGTYQRIGLVELDGPRERKVRVEIL